MAPDSNSVDADHVDGIVDVVVPLKDVEDDELSQGEEQQDEEQQQEAEAEDQEEGLPVVSILPQEQLQERRLEDVRRVRDEAESLRHEICNLRTRLEEVEEESKFHAAKANELQELLMNSHSTSGNSGIDATILKQADELAKKTCQIEALEKKITEITIQKTMLEVERDEAKKESLELSHVVRSLQNVTKSSMERSLRSRDKSDDDDSSSSESEDSDDESEDSEEIVLTPESALDLTLGNLKEHIEMLEDGLQASSTLNTEQKKNINHLENDIKAQQAQISMLEGLFRELNAANQLHFHKEQEEKDAKDDKEKGASAESTTPSHSSPASPKSSSPNTEAKERTLKKLGLAFRGIRMPSMSMPARKEKALDIPEEAAAAAQAAAYLLGDIQADSAPPKDSDANNNDNAKKKKEKKTAMKKVKIRFKKAGLEGTYTGPLVDKKPHGVGTIRFTNGNTYLGEMRKGKMSGSGTLYTKNNGVFRGLFENNQFVGESPLNSSSHHSRSHNDDENSNPNKDTAPGNGSSHSRSSCDGSDPAADSTEKSCDATATTAHTEAHEEEEDEEAKANAVAALELDAFSPSNICEAPIDDSFNMVVNLEGMERKTELDEIRKLEKQEENESFLREFSGSEHSSSLRNELLDASMSSDESPIPEPEAHEVF